MPLDRSTRQAPGHTIVRGACPHDCPDTCALHVTVADGRAIKVEGDPDHPTTRGVLCTKVARYLERTYHPDQRVLHPMRRVGAKGEGRFERIGWDEALDTIASRFKTIADSADGPQAILPYSYAGTMGLLQYGSMDRRFFHRLGASLLDRTICATAGTAGYDSDARQPIGTDLEQFEDAKLIIIWGSNPVVSNLHLWARVQEAKRRGAKLIAIDPYRSQTAEKCHDAPRADARDRRRARAGHHARPDREDLLDRDYLDRYTLGFDALERRVREYPPARVASHHRHCAKRRSSRWLATTARTRAGAHPRSTTACSGTRGGGMAMRTIACLPALIGAWRRRGRRRASVDERHLSDQHTRRSSVPTWPDTARARSTCRRSARRCSTSRRSADPRAVRLQLEPGRGGAGLEQGRRRLRARRPVHGRPRACSRPTPPTTPTSCCRRRRSSSTSTCTPPTATCYVLANNPAIAPLGEAKPNTEVFRLLAARMGFDERLLRGDRRRAWRPMHSSPVTRAWPASTGKR